MLIPLLTVSITLLTVALLASCQQNQPAPDSEPFEPLDISPDAWQARGQTFHFADHNIFFVDEGAGDGPAVLLLHGYPTSSWDFHKIWGGLAAEQRVIAPDFLGYGFSDKPTGYDYSIAHNADLIAVLLTELGIDAVQVVAHDIGVNVAEELVARAEEGELLFTIDSLVLLNGTLFDAERQPTTTQQLLAGPLGATINLLASESTLVSNLTTISGPNANPLEFSAHWYLLNYPDSARLTHKLLHTVNDRIQNETRWADALCTTEIPLHLMIGVDDPTSGLRLRDSLASYCGSQENFSRENFEVTLFEGVGHFPQLEAPDDLLDALKLHLTHEQGVIQGATRG